jgi:SAM-dependent methyltransferase
MSGEAPRDAPLAPPAEGEGLTKPVAVAEPPAIEPDGASLLRPPPSVPRPAGRKPTFTGGEVDLRPSAPPLLRKPTFTGANAVTAVTGVPATSGAPPASGGATTSGAPTSGVPDGATPAAGIVIPKPALMPNLTGGNGASARPETDKPAPGEPQQKIASTPPRAPGSSPDATGASRRRSRRSVLGGADEDTEAAREGPMSDVPSTGGGAAPAEGRASAASAEGRASAVPAEGRTSITNQEPPKTLTLPPEAEEAAVDDAAMIRPMRIINIGPTEGTVEVSARTSSLPPVSDLSPRSVNQTTGAEPTTIPRPPRPPSFTAEVEAIVEVDADDEAEIVDDEMPATQPSDFLDAPPRSEEIEEIEPEGISEAEEQASLTPAPRKPPPPPPKRSTPESGPPQQPSSAAGSPDTAPTADPMRKRQKPWWEDLFGDDFTRTMDHVDPKVVRRECDFIDDRLSLEQGAVMLDLCCGGGDHAVELASRGYSVVGYDLSLAMLARAADVAQERGQKLNFLQGDMREMAFEETFDGVYCWATSFGYFDDDKNLDVLLRIRRALRKGGMLLLDVINRDYIAPRQPSLVWFEGDGCVCMDEMSVDFFSSRLRVKRTVMFEDGRSKEVDYSIRIYALHELGKMLHDCGFKVVEVTGHPAHAGVFFGSESPRIIVLAERD